METTNNQEVHVQVENKNKSWKLKLAKGFLFVIDSIEYGSVFAMKVAGGLILTGIAVNMFMGNKDEGK